MVSKDPTDTRWITFPRGLRIRHGLFQFYQDRNDVCCNLTWSETTLGLVKRYSWLCSTRPLEKHWLYGKHLNSKLRILIDQGAKRETRRFCNPVSRQSYLYNVNYYIVESSQKLSQHNCYMSTVNYIHLGLGLKRKCLKIFIHSFS